MMLDHVSIQCADVAASAAFYDAVLAPLGGQRIMDFGDVVGYGAPPMPDFWIGARATGEGFRESHLAFSAPDRAAVDAFVEQPPRPARRCCTQPGNGRNITPTTTAASYGIRTATTLRRSATNLCDAGRDAAAQYAPLAEVDEKGA
jgi:catechol 2,3-dioxygenase-like lactoylglutathione lyase family enzyme